MDISFNGNIIIYRGFNIHVQAIDEYGAYYNTAYLDIDIDGNIGEKYCYSKDKEIESIEDAIKWVDKTYDETLQINP